ncbi:MAG: undecaprenyldiphospho-muramoylpentapeptide beta-N-acetylglucosaminyltransferase [Cytophagales bacterium]|nr:undecaprenyldiphospho-muramoylpentapeptide beta-N-acetylglucosaminyltransferase [Cytophagales bacterium]
MENKKPYRFVLSGGGTGGHIYPALAVAHEIRVRQPDAEILFVGANGKMEMTKVPEAGFEIVGLNISGLQRKITLKNLLFPFKVLSSFFSARQILRKFKPDAVVGFGGYASGPIMLAANAKKLPSMIQEQNSYAGITNKRLGKQVRKVCVAYEGMEKYFPTEKIVLTGNPVRNDILDLEDKKQKALSHFGLKQGIPTVLVLGGSLGARTINDSIIGDLQKVIDAGVQLVWQTGKFYYQEMKTLAKGLELGNIRILEFISEMDLAYAVADVVVSRAGALSISELCLVGRPVIFVPSPNVAEDHQTKNAQALTQKEAALLVKDVEAKEFLVSTALELLKNNEKKGVLAANIKALGRPKATKDIVNELMTLVD